MGRGSFLQLEPRVPGSSSFSPTAELPGHGWNHLPNLSITMTCHTARATPNPPASFLSNCHFQSTAETGGLRKALALQLPGARGAPGAESGMVALPFHVAPLSLVTQFSCHQGIWSSKFKGEGRERVHWPITCRKGKIRKTRRGEARLEVIQ